MTAGSVIAHYRITAKLGEGGMGAVYRAIDTKLNREVAIKILPPAFAADSARMQRFEREAQVLASLNHPNIAAIYGVEAGAIVMELVPGENLKGPVPIETAIEYARQIAAALESAHEKGIVHRDLKPANIKVTDEGTVKLLDFGLAKATEETASAAGAGSTQSPTLSLAMTQAGMILGTAAYMSPEQARGKPVDRRADIWAFGAVLFELLSGGMLFGGGETVGDSLAAVITKEPDWSALPKDTPPHVRRLLQRCLRKDPKLRLRDIGEARIALDEPEAAAGLAPPAIQRRRTWLPWAAALLALALAAAAWLRPTAADPGPGVARFSWVWPEGTAEPGSPALAQAAPSPDGRYIVFAARTLASGKDELWLRSLESTTAHRLEKTESASAPFWSPDGQFIAFFAEGKLKRVSLTGGIPLTICDTGAEEIFTRTAGNGGAWNRDGVILFATFNGAGLRRVSASGGHASEATKPDPASEEESHSWPQFLPDGKHFLYFARSTAPGKSAVYVQELGSTQRILVMRNQLRAAWAPPGYLLFARDASLFAQRMNPRTFQLEGEPATLAQEVSTNDGNGRAAFAVSANGVLVLRVGSLYLKTQLTWYDRAGKVVAPVGNAGNFREAVLSPSEKTAAVLVGLSRASAGLWSADLNTGALTRIGDARNAYVNIGPWSPDSSRIVVRGSSARIQVVTLASGAVETWSEQPLTVYAWSPDGRDLICGNTENQVLLQPAAAGGKPRILVSRPYGTRALGLSPDGKWVVYSSNQTGRFEIFTAAFPSFDEMKQISKDGGEWPLWRADGRELLYLAPDNMLMAAAVRPGNRLDVADPIRLFKLNYNPVSLYSAYGPSRDGRRILVNEAVERAAAPQLTLVLNWTRDLKP